jgi:hypothetical protein
VSGDPNESKRLNGEVPTTTLSGSRWKDALETRITMPSHTSNPASALRQRRGRTAPFATRPVITSASATPRAAIPVTRHTREHYPDATPKNMNNMCRAQTTFNKLEC